MAEVKTEQEPSIEEILESIRQIISEDTEEAKPVAEAKLEVVKDTPPPPPPIDLSPPKPVPAAAPAPAPLSLTPDVAKPVETKLAPSPLDLTDKIAAAPLDLTPPPPPPPVTIEMMDSPMTDTPKPTDNLMSPETASAVTDSLSKLLATNVAVETETTGRTGKVTLEDMTRDLMKPLIKTWLDQNLPALIEKAVQKEVEKLARRVMDR